MCCANHDWALVRECIPNAKRVALMRHLANPALNLQVEASNAAAPELAGVVVPHTASIQMHAAQNQIFGLVLCRFSDACMPTPSTRADGRRRRSAKARNRGMRIADGAAGYGELALRGTVTMVDFWVEHWRGRPVGG